LTDAWGWRLLHVAAQKGQLEVAKLLWERDPERDPRTLRRALYLGVQSGHKETIRYFLDEGAVRGEALKALYLKDLSGLRASLVSRLSQVSEKDEDGNTLLHVAANIDFPSAARLLLEQAAPLEARNGRGETPLFRSISNNARKVAEILIAHGADVDTITDYGQNCLHCAATTYKPHLVALLVAHGIDPRFDDVHVASALGRLDRVQALVGRRPDLVNERDPFGYTPLYWAIAGKHREVYAFLLKSGASPNIVSRQGRTCLHLARESRDTDAVALLKSHGATQ
jgi:ankyrin repeat protein